MPQFRVTTTTTTEGNTFTQTDTYTPESVSAIDMAELPAAKTGSLTTRTNNTDGTITGASGHGVASNAVVCLFWDGGARHNVTVGTVSGTSIPISGGSGDNLPVANTAVTFQAVATEVFAVPANSAKVVTIEAPLGKLAVRFLDGSNALVFAKVFEANAKETYTWHENAGAANPFSTSAVASVVWAQGNSNQAVSPRVRVGYTT